MSSYHKPKIFRSLHGCCICKAKSSSSRFTYSYRYEEDFRQCFKVNDVRSGDICNACVLLVKRYRRLPKGSKKNWEHVVGARAGISHKAASTLVRQKSKQQPKDDPDLKFKKIVKKRTKSAPTHHAPSTPDQDVTKGPFCASPTPTDASVDSAASRPSSIAEPSPFLDTRYWKRTGVCCGTVFIGQHGDLALDMNLYKPCSGHRRRGPGSASSRSRADTASSYNSSEALPLSESSTNNPSGAQQS